MAKYSYRQLVNAYRNWGASVLATVNGTEYESFKKRYLVTDEEMKYTSWMLCMGDFPVNNYTNNVPRVVGVLGMYSDKTERVMG